MRIQKYVPHLVVLGMLVTATIIIRHAPDISVIEAPAVMTALPDRVGEWIGEELNCCQNESCMKTFPNSELSGGKLCPACGGMLASWSLGERKLFPPDTVLIRKLYRCDSKPALVATIVISSSEDVSIHRPQMCLTGQGYDIAGERTREIPLMGRGLLRVRVMDLFRRWHGAGGGMVEVPIFYAFWFVSREHETPSSGWRIFYATWDRVVHGRVFRWAYVSVTGERTVGSSVYEQQLQSFIRDLYPQIVAKGKQ